MKYNVWLIPTPKARRTFKWESRKLNSVPLDKDSADELRYLSERDAATADQAEYMRYVIQPLELNDTDHREIEQIPVDAYLSEARLEELQSLISNGYPASAILSAVREAVFAATKNIMIPPAINR